MRDDVRHWLEPLVAELARRDDAVAVLTATDTSRLPPSALALLAGLGTGNPPNAGEVDWIAVGGVLREALGWQHYPATPPGLN